MDQRITLSRALFVKIVIATGCVAVSPQAAALDHDAIVIGVLGSEQYDSNLFALPDEANPPNGARRSAQTRAVGVGLHVRETYGLQTIALDTDVARLHYVPYRDLDLTTYAISATWNWTLTPQLTGLLLFDQTKAPNSFADTGFQTSANPRKTEDFRFNVDYRPGAAIHPRFSILQNEDLSATTVQNRDNSRTTSVEGALIYEFRSTNTASVYFRHGRGHYSDLGTDGIGVETAPLVSSFDENETGLEAHWIYSGLSTFDGNIGYLTRHHQEASERNFSGPVGKFKFVYLATGRIAVEVSGSSTLSSAQSDFSSYSHDTQIGIAPAYSLTGKITIRPSFVLSRRSFEGAPTAGADALHYVTRQSNLQVDWAALRSVDITATGFRASRVSNNAGFQYVDNGAMVKATVRF